MYSRTLEILSWSQPWRCWSRRKTAIREFRVSDMLWQNCLCRSLFFRIAEAPLPSRWEIAQQELKERVEEKQQDAAYDPKGLLAFCQEPRTRKEIITYLNISSEQYALRKYLDPLVQCGAIQLTVPEKPKSRKQKYVAAERKD